MNRIQEMFLGRDNIIPEKIGEELREKKQIIAHLDAAKKQIEEKELQLNELNKQLENKNKELIQINHELEKRRFEIIELDNNLKKINDNLKLIERTYGSNIVDKLIKFGGPKLLELYISNSFNIYQRSKETVLLSDELKRKFKEKFRLDHDVRLYMDHILFNFMRQDALSLINIINYEITEDKPVNLKSSYIKSVEIANKINNQEGSLAWFVNQRIPKTYIEATSVDYHLDNIYDIFCSKPEIDVRRMHLFYKKYLTKNFMSTIPFINTQAMFNTLLLEYVHGVDARVLCIESYENVKKILFEKGEDFANNYLFLLDFALYFSKDEHSIKDYLTGEPHILCADFIAEDPTEKALKTPEEEFTFRTNEYERDKVYDFDNPMIYSIYKNYFLTLWNRDKYVNYLQYYLRDRESHNNYKEIKKLYNTIKNDIKVYDFIDFWRMSKNVFGSANLFDPGIFDNKYLWRKFEAKYPNHGKQNEEIMRDIKAKISSFNIPDSNEEAYNKLNEVLGNYILRKIHTNVCFK